jgi:hypothetical protein
MKRGAKLFFITLISLPTAMSACSQTTGDHKTLVSERSQTDTQARQRADTAGINPGQLFTRADAEKIMGQPSHLSDSSTRQEDDVLTYRCSYEADAKDSISQRAGAIYFLFEDFRLTELAQKKYAEIKNANEHLGIEVLDNLGDEAYYHSDGTNFHFIMVRKGDKVFNLKVNKITESTDLGAFKRIARKITASII